MNMRFLLDADMRTIGRWLLEGWRWWLDELRAFVPARFRGARSSAGLPCVFRDGALVPLGRTGAGRIPEKPKAGTRATILVPDALCLSRVIARPALGERDVQRMVALEAETLLPIPAGSAVVAGRIKGPADVPGKILIEVAGLPVEQARAIARAVESAGIVPVGIVTGAAAGARGPLDFAPAMRALGILTRRRSATPYLWGLVALLLLLDIGAWIWRDAAQVARFEQIVAGQQPAVTVAQAIGRRADHDRRIVAQSLSLRRTHDPLQVMGEAGAALPPGAWLQRYVWDGASIRLAGYRPPKVDVATALRRSGRFAEVRTASDETQAAIPAGDPFDISARVAGQ